MDQGTDEAQDRTQSSQEAAVRFNYALGLFLICAGERSYFLAHEGYSADEEDDWMRWYPEYDKPLGPPRATAPRDASIYSREFAHASVRVNLKTREARIDWGP